MSEIYVEMELREIQIREDSPTQVIILAEKDGARQFPIYIGYYEARALDDAVRGEQGVRPMTHDLILNVVDGIQAQFTRALVVKLQNETFFGALELQLQNGEILRVDSRPSDAIVLSAKRDIPVFVEETVLAAAQPHQSSGEEAGD